MLLEKVLGGRFLGADPQVFLKGLIEFGIKQVIVGTDCCEETLRQGDIAALVAIGFVLRWTDPRKGFKVLRRPENVDSDIVKSIDGQQIAGRTELRLGYGLRQCIIP